MKQPISKTYFGFWVYLMTDLTMFAGLFAAFAVLRGNAFGGPSESQIYNLPYVLAETLILLTSSFTAGLAVICAHQRKRKTTALFLFATFLLGACFLSMEIYEFSGLFHQGATFQRSGFLSSYFTLVGTHGLHIFAGLLWMVILFFFMYRRGMTDSMVRKLTLWGLFWHFLDIVWIFIFTIVYLIGVAL